MLENIENCAELAERIRTEMYSDGYSRKSVDKHFGYVCNALEKFCGEHFGGKYSAEAGESFMDAIRMKKLSKDYTALFRHSVDRFNHALDGDFHWRPVKHRKKSYASSCYDSTVNAYEEYLFQTGKTQQNVRCHVHLVARFLAHMESIGVTDLCMIEPEHIHERFKAAAGKEGFGKIMKAFFRYAYKYRLISNDISCWIPMAPRHKPIPTVYSLEETEKILASIDRGTCIGKRDYCIVLMAAKLGIRACDITKLNMDDIGFTEKNIRLVQQKTGVAIEFPVLQEMSAALEDYLNLARPDSFLPNVFLTVPRPETSALSTQGIYDIVSGAIARSGVDTRFRRRGAHALRSSLASQLLDEGRTYPEIQQVLGQTSPDAAKHYVRVEAERLRECALEVLGFQNGAAASFFGKQVV